MFGSLFQTRVPGVPASDSGERRKEGRAPPIPNPLAASRRSPLSERLEHTG